MKTEEQGKKTEKKNEQKKPPRIVNGFFEAPRPVRKGD